MVEVDNWCTTCPYSHATGATAVTVGTAPRLATRLQKNTVHSVHGVSVGLSHVSSNLGTASDSNCCTWSKLVVNWEAKLLTRRFHIFTRSSPSIVQSLLTARVEAGIGPSAGRHQWNSAEACRRQRHTDSSPVDTLQ